MGLLVLVLARLYHALLLSGALLPQSREAEEEGAEAWEMTSSPARSAAMPRITANGKSPVVAW